MSSAEKLLSRHSAGARVRARPKLDANEMMAMKRKFLVSPPNLFDAFVHSTRLTWITMTFCLALLFLPGAWLALAVR